ncbi:MAG TPA: hypothetical protein VLA69_06800 [Gaiellaceae bacterium]|nr:hypothetical protein [Gaiellaceae bacterium]
MQTVTNPDHRRSDDRESTSDAGEGLGGLVRKVFTTRPTPEERLEQLLAERRRELDEHAARFDASIADLERREELLRDSRAAVERMLRLGSSDLEARESELTDFLRDFTDREARLAEAEADLARRRGELGAVELVRAAVERRERDVAAREDRVAERESQVEKRDAPTDTEPGRVTRPVELAVVPGAGYRLLEIAGLELARGDTFELDGVEYVVVRTGPSPLPVDSRRCAYLIRGAGGASSSGSS